MEKFNKNPIVITIAISVTIFSIYLIIDFLNIPEFLNIDLNRVDTKTFEIFLNSLTLITLFAVTYFTIDSMNSKRMINQEKIADILLKTAYQSCLETISLLENEKAKQIIISKIDFNKLNTDSPVFLNLYNESFKNEKDIVKLANEGVITATKFETYLQVKNDFHRYVSSTITFFDKKEYYISNLNKVTKLLKNEISNLEV
ncbi:hypothetical protein [Anaerorhabdus sp.]|uniref:hypothetical protein n=1 Tax=Anaerorhabdus sp. TaxID=1872524 RepID=UPI002FCAC5AF